MKHNKTRSNFPVLALSVLVCVLPACSMSPDYERPQTAVDNVQSYRNVDNDQDAGVPPQSTMTSAWWTSYDDDTLAEMIKTLDRQNLGLAAAAERIAQARARGTQAGADLWPQIGAGASRTRTKSPANNGSRFSSFSAGDSYVTSYDASLSASWQFDLFGKVAEARKSAQSLAEAAALDYDALYQSLVAELLNLRVSIAATQRQIDFIEKLVANSTQQLESLKRRYNAGAGGVSALDLENAREAHARYESRKPALTAQLKDQLYKLDVLLGALPGTYEQRLSNDFPLLPPPRDFSVPPPAALLDERPDIMADELRLMAANADIGVAVADLYPGFGISGGYGFQSGQLDDLIRADQIAWNIATNITMRIFEGGRLRSGIDIQESEAREMAATYADTVLNAVREVEIALVNEREFRREYHAIQDRAYAGWTAEKFAKKRYEKGLIGLQDYLTIQSNYYEAQIAQIQTEQAIWQARIALHLALGGDWDRAGKQDNG